MRTAAGKAKLLPSETFVKFHNLFQQNMDLLSSQKNNEKSVQTAKANRPDLVTLLSELGGFWTMAVYQVDDAPTQFKSLMKCVKKN